MSKKLLVVVDYQNDFVDGALGFEKATKKHRKVRIYLFLTVSHRQKDMNFMENCSL